MRHHRFSFRKVQAYLGGALLGASLIVELCRCEAARAREMYAFRPASSEPQQDLSVGEILKVDPGRTNVNGNLLSEVVPSGKWSVYLEPRANTNFSGLRKPVEPEVPRSIACLYANKRPDYPKCGTSDNSLPLPTGGAGVVAAVVIAYDHPNIISEVQTFVSRYKLPDANIKIIYTGQNAPRQDQSENNGWDLEAAFDVEWLHALAPKTNILLVEADDNTFTSMIKAIKLASTELENGSGGVVTMSFSWPVTKITPELEQQFDQVVSEFHGVTYISSTGDEGNLVFPATSQRVIAVGGTLLTRDDAGNFQSEIAWSKSGAGKYGQRPKYQDQIAKMVGVSRGVADIAAAANNNDRGGFSFFSNSLGWVGFFGTSASAPIIAALVADAHAANAHSFETVDELKGIYSRWASVGQVDFNSVKDGHCGSAPVYKAVPGWNFCTGVGTPNGFSGL